MQADPLLWDQAVKGFVDAYLVRVSVEVKVLQEACGKLAEQEVVGVVYGPQTPVGVVVGTGAGTEGAHWKIRQRRFWSDTRLKAETRVKHV